MCTSKGGIMKKFLAIILVIITIFTLACCQRGIKSEYDSQGRLIKEAHPDHKPTGYITYEYGDDGQLSKKSEFNGSYIFHVTYYEGGKISYSEELVGGIVRARLSYDENDRVTRKDSCDFSGKIIEGSYYLYSYNEVGEMTEERYSDGALAERTQYGKNGKPVLDEWFDTSTGELHDYYEYTYFDDGGYSKKHVSLNIDSTGNSFSIHYYDKNDLNTRTDHYYGEEITYSYVYSYDKNGNMTKEECFDHGQPDGHTVYSYDKDGNKTKIVSYSKDNLLIQETIIENGYGTKYVYSYTNGNRWVWGMQRGSVTNGGYIITSDVYTIYNENGDYVTIESPENTSSASVDEETGAITATSIKRSKDGSTVITITDYPDGSSIRTVETKVAYNATGEQIECTDALLASFNTVPKY